MAVNSYLTAEERRTLEHARIGIAGAGGLGSNCAMHLVRSGVRRLVIADFDTVASSNLNRQFFFADQVGRKKVEALRENLLRIEPGLELEIHDVRLTAENMTRVFADCDVVAEAFDMAESKDLFLRELLPGEKKLVAVSGIGGVGRSGELGVRRVGKNLVLIGDLTRGVDTGVAPWSSRVGIAAAMQANSILAMLLNQPL